MDEYTIFWSGLAYDCCFDEKEGLPCYSGIARLHKLVDLFGDLELQTAEMKFEYENGIKVGFVLTSEFKTRDGAPVKWVEERGPGRQRATKFRFQYEDGALFNEENEGGNFSPHGLFATDLAMFLHEVNGDRKESYFAMKQQVLHCMKLASEIEALLK